MPAASVRLRNTCAGLLRSGSLATGTRPDRYCACTRSAMRCCRGYAGLHGSCGCFIWKFPRSCVCGIMIPRYTFFWGLVLLAGCREPAVSQTVRPPASLSGRYDTATRTIHVMVALCDNRYQGIVPVPAKIGNGQDPAGNLYWGCAYGVRTFFRKSKSWILVGSRKGRGPVLERLVFRHKASGWY